MVDLSEHAMPTYASEITSLAGFGSLERMKPGMIPGTRGIRDAGRKRGTRLVLVARRDQSRATSPPTTVWLSRLWMLQGPSRPEELFPGPAV